MLTDDTLHVPTYPISKGLLAYPWWNGALSTLHCAAVQEEGWKARRAPGIEEGGDREKNARGREQQMSESGKVKTEQGAENKQDLGGGGGFWSAVCRC